MTTTETRMIAADLRRRGFRVGTPSPAGVWVAYRNRRPMEFEVRDALADAGYDPCMYEIRPTSGYAAALVVCAVVA